MFHAQVRFSFYGKLFRAVFRAIPDSYFCYRIFDLHSERKRYLQNFHVFTLFVALARRNLMTYNEKWLLIHKIAVKAINEKLIQKVKKKHSKKVSKVCFYKFY